MVRLIIIVLALLQESAEEHRAEYHQKISADDDHYDRDEEHEYRAQGFGYHDGGNICADEQSCADDAEKRISFRRLLAEVFAPYQSHRARAHYLAHGVDKEEQEDNGENADGQQYCSRRDMENIADISAAYRLDESEFGELRERDAEHKAAEERYGRSYQALPKEQDADILFVHAEDVIESELLLPAADEKRICIEKKDAGKYSDDPAAEHEHDADRTLAERALERLAVAQENNDIIHHYHAYLR